MKFSAASGIAIAPILFVIVLLAILATAIASATSSFSGGTDSEKARVYATAIIDYSNTVATAVQRIMALGCADTQISFENSFVSGYTNANAPTDRHCHVFDIAGGSIVWASSVEDSTTNYTYAARIAIHSIGTGTPSSHPDSSVELIMFLPVSDQKICNEINILLGNENNIVIDWYNNAWRFSGAYTYGHWFFDSGGNESGYYGKMAACVQTSSELLSNVGQPYFYYKVLIVR